MVKGGCKNLHRPGGCVPRLHEVGAFCNRSRICHQIAASACMQRWHPEAGPKGDLGPGIIERLHLPCKNLSSASCTGPQQQLIAYQDQTISCYLPAHMIKPGSECHWEGAQHPEQLTLAEVLSWPLVFLCQLPMRDMSCCAAIMQLNRSTLTKAPLDGRDRKQLVL